MHAQITKNDKFDILRKKWVRKLNFLQADKHRNFLQVDFNTLCIKVFYEVILSLLKSMIKHSQSTLSTNIPKKKLGMEFIFCMQTNIKVGIIMEVARHVQSTQNKKLVIFLL